MVSVRSMGIKMMIKTRKAICVTTLCVVARNFLKNKEIKDIGYYGKSLEDIDELFKENTLAYIINITSMSLPSKILLKATVCFSCLRKIYLLRALPGLFVAIDIPSI